jgi:hypothetical protein
MILPVKKAKTLIRGNSKKIFTCSKSK